MGYYLCVCKWERGQWGGATVEFSDDGLSVDYGRDGLLDLDYAVEAQDLDCRVVLDLLVAAVLHEPHELLHRLGGGFAKALDRPLDI